MRADFIGGVWDGKTYELPDDRNEWQVAVLEQKMPFAINYTEFPKPTKYNIAVYKHVINGIFWFSEIRKSE